MGSLLEHGIQIPARRQRNDLESFGIGFGQVESAAANGAGRAQYGNTSHAEGFLSCAGSGERLVFLQ